MRTAIFMMPKSFTRGGGIPTDYRFEERACDKRTGFYKSFAKREISTFNAVSAAERMGLKVFYENGKLARILAPDAKTARAYYEYMKTLGYEK